MLKRAFISFLFLASGFTFAADKPVPVTAEPLQSQVIYPEVSVPATVLSVNDAKISAEVSAVVYAISANVGDVVDKGAILLQFDAEDYRYALQKVEAQLRAVEAKIELAEFQLARTKILSVESAASEENVRQREAELKGLKAQQEGLRADLGLAKQNLRKCVVRAPFKAVVTQRLAQVGALASPGTPLFQLVDLSRIEISAKLQAQDVAALNGGKEFYFETDGKIYPVELRTVTPAFNPVERSRDARFVFLVERALPGAAGTLTWKMSQPHLPADRIVRRNRQLGIFVLENDAAQFIPLLQAREGRPAAVDLPLNTRVVTDGRFVLQPGDRVVLR